MKLFCVVILFVESIGFCFGQAYPKYKSPLDIPLSIAGSFGELRFNHFHSGIDIKTKQREGFQVKAVENGFVGRIGISHRSYGKVIYIYHSDGYITVYGHLKKFASKIENYVKKQQYRKKRYEVNLLLPKDSIRVSRGEVIAYSGNTGGSFAPHLHFEVRKIIGQIPMNPMLFGIKVYDHTRPIIKAIYGYPISDRSQINGFQHPVQINFTQLKDGSLLADPIIAKGKIGLGIVSYDRLKGTKNKNGIYSTSIYENGSKIFEYKFDKMPFSLSREINTFMDYEKYIIDKIKIQKCFITSGNHLGIYTKKVDNGVLDIVSGFSYKVDIIVSDFAKNKTKISLPIRGKSELIATPRIEKKGTFIEVPKDYSFRLKNVQIYFPQNTFFENFNIEVDEFNSVFRIGNNTIPVKKEYDIRVNISKYVPSIRDKLFLAYETKKGPRYQPSRIKRDKLYAKAKGLGNFKVMIDSTPPVIKAENFENNKILKKTINQLIFKTSDNMSGIASYKGTINDRWVLLEYDYKKQTLTYDINDIKYSRDTLQIRVVVKDNVGNQNYLNTSVLYPSK